MYRITPAFEVTKVDDIIDIVNYFICVLHIVGQIGPLHSFRNFMLC